jgi:hypothetical protein
MIWTVKKDATVMTTKNRRRRFEVSMMSSDLELT